MPLNRIHAVEIRQPVLWRLTGWWIVQVDVAGYGAMSGSDSGSTMILPVGSKQQALQIAALVTPLADEQLADRTSAALAAQQTAHAQAAPTPAARRSTYTTRQYTSKPVSSSSYYVGNGMWCTDYVHSRRPDIAVYGNAGYNWISSAQAAGKSTGGTPRAGAVAVTNGHVAYVESVNGDGSYTVSEMGWNYRAGNYNKRTVRPGTFGQFIY